MTREKVSPLKLTAIMKAEANTVQFARGRAQGRSDSDTLAAIIRNPGKKVILGLWSDDGEADYCGITVIKGHSFDLKAIGSDDIDAIHCACVEEALAMGQVFGDNA
jgi:hypothetical protein